jgi:integrase/recombinase XerD
MEVRKTRVAVDTIKNECMELKTFFRWCQENKYIKANPAASLKPTGKRRKGKPQLRRGEAQALADLCFRDAMNDPSALAALLALTLGMRSGEILKLRRYDVDFASDGTWVWIDDGKTENAKRSIYVPEALAVLLREYCKGLANDAPVFKGRGTDTRVPTWFRKNLRRLCKKAGVSYVPPHGLRGTWATLAESGGAASDEVMKQLGHGSRKVTEGNYIAPGVVEAKRNERMMKVIKGGKEG